MVLAATMLLAGAAGLGSGSARAQYSTYEDAPFQQGSLFYRPGGRPKPPRVAAPRRVAAPAGNVPQSGYSYSQAGGYTYRTNVPQAAYTYAPRSGTYYVQPQTRYRRGLFGWFR